MNADLPGAVLFDLDGLLVDSEPLWFEAERLTMMRLGGQWSPADQVALLGGSLERTVRYLLAKAGAPVPGTGRQALEDSEVAHWLLGAMADLIRSHGLPPRPGARELLAEVTAERIPYALVTSSQRKIMWAALAAAGLEFPVTVCGEDVVHRKPHPEPYLRAASLLDADPRSAVALEDSPTGLASAAAAGCAAVAVPSVPLPETLPPGVVTVASLLDVDLPRLRKIAAGHWDSASAIVCDDEGNGAMR